MNLFIDGIMDNGQYILGTTSNNFVQEKDDKVNITLSVSLLNILEINLVNSKFSILFSLTMKWLDSRLDFKVFPFRSLHFVKLILLLVTIH